MTHPSAVTIEGFVSGEIEAQAELTQHLADCAACADAVRAAARVELALFEAGAAAKFCVGCQSVVVGDRCASCGAALRVRDYRVEGLLASGPLGRMYAATDSSGARVALKEISFHAQPDAEALAAFEREARVLERVKHPCIPRFVDSFCEGRGVEARAYLVQELIEGESLAQLLAKRQLDEKEVVEIAGQVLDVLVYLQSLSPMVFHRDIKPANLIRRPDGSIALVDFGAARDHGSTAGATLVGTFGYMPIEQLAGIVDATTDLHALGATLWHLVTRIEPWRLWAEPLLQRRANVSSTLRHFLDRLVEREPKRRFADAKAARAALGLRPPISRNVRPAFKWALAATLLVIVSPFVTFGLVLMFGPKFPRPPMDAKITPLQAAALLREANAAETERVRQRVERLLEYVVGTEDVRLGVSGHDPSDAFYALQKANKQAHLDGLMALDLDRRTIVAVGNVPSDADALTVFRPKLGEVVVGPARSIVTSIGSRPCVVAIKAIEFVGRKTAEVMAFQPLDGVAH